VEEQNWNEEFERSLEPVRIDDTLTIRQSWSDADAASEELVITIDPKMSFGTGHHESTRLIARLLHRESLDGKRVLDIGTGTGILAILAVKMGASPVVAIDNNEWAVANARENLKLNGAGDRVELRLAQLEDLEPSQWDCVVANLHTNLITHLLPELSKRLRMDGCILTSGVVEDDYERLLRAARDCGLECDVEERENEWVASRFVKGKKARGGE
jgi:ribosomal protein L11 methyltransferase